ncbi:Pyoverdine/dityrosine biosynthesis protein, partial [Avibacterium avium]
MFINSQKLSQISSSHRLFELTSSIRHRLSPLKGSNAMTIDQRFFINEILDSLIDKHSFLLQSRLQ